MALRALFFGGLVSGILIAASPGVGAEELPSAYQAELRQAKKVQFGQSVALGTCEKASWTKGCTKIGRLVVRIDGITAERNEGASLPTFRVTLNVQNFSSITSGVLPRIRCSNILDPGGWNSGDVDTQSIPPKSQVEGFYTVLFPSTDGYQTTISPSTCKNAVLWMYPRNKPTSKPRGGKVAIDAYIPLPADFLQRLEAEASTSAG